MPEPTRTQILVITGTVGVGKSSVADEVYEILKKQSAHLALINLDELGYTGTAPKDDPFNINLRFKNLQAIWKNYEEAGTKGVIIPFVVEHRQSIKRFTQAIPNADIHVIRLDAPIDVVKERIRKRPMGGSLEWHLKRAAELAQILKHNKPEDIVIETVGKSISDVAKEIIKSWDNLKHEQFSQ